MISIALTTYNGEKYISQQLDSILSQTYSDFELIICDDCSSDSTIKILQNYQEKDSRIKIYINENNLGFKKNFEKAISLCKGDFIALSDQDDIWLPNHLEILLKNIGNCDISCADSQLIDELNNSLNITLSQTDEFYSFFNSSKSLYRILCKSNCFQGANMLIKKQFFEKALPIPPLAGYHDAWFAACACCDNGINYTYDIITKYRQHSSQVTTGVHQKKTFLFLIKRLLIRRLSKKQYKTDRFVFINELSSRYNLNDELKKIISDCYEIQLILSKQYNFFNRLIRLHIFFSNYKYIYARYDNKYRILRTLKNLF